jgi:hypothetical protein
MRNGRWSLVAVWQKTSQGLTNPVCAADSPGPAHAGLAGAQKARFVRDKISDMDDVARPEAMRGLVRGLVSLAAA